MLYGETTSAQVRRLVEAQIADAPEGLDQRDSHRHVSCARRSSPRRGEAYVDLGGRLAATPPAGSLDEALAVYAIVNAVAVNLPDIIGRADSHQRQGSRQPGVATSICARPSQSPWLGSRGPERTSSNNDTN